MLLLAIESSCDETSVAVVRDGVDILALEIASQLEEHRPFGGVVPELASRGHLRVILPILQRCLSDARVTWKDIDAIAATAGPGLIGSLLVGLETAKTLAWLHHKPLLPTHHLLGHADSPFLRMPGAPLPPARQYPYLAFLVSGGHSSLVRVERPDRVATLGETRDDAVGEAYDKVGKLLGLRYPGGPEIDTLAAHGNPTAFHLPRPMVSREADRLDMSFSGLKTAVVTAIRGRDLDDQLRADICASFQEAATDVLIDRARRALDREPADANGRRRLTVAGGVACNRRLREKLADLSTQRAARGIPVDIFLPPPILCTDNAAMIAGAAWALATDGGTRSWASTALPPVDDWMSLNPRAGWPLDSVNVVT